MAGLAAIAALASLAVLAVPPGIADLSAFAPRQSLARLDETNALPTPVQWRAAQRPLERAARLDPDNPSHYEEMARWHERYTLRLSPKSELARAYLEQSAADLRRAAALRPSSPYTWANLAVVLRRLERYDAEFQQAVLNAARLGPWEVAVQLALAYVAFTAPGELAPEGMAAAQRAMANAARRYDKELFDLAAVHGGMAVLCAVPGITISPLAVRCI